MYFSTVLKFFAPGSFIFLAILILMSYGLIDDLIPTLSKIYPVAVFFTGIFLGWRFSRSRLIFTIIVLAVADRLLLGLTFDKNDVLRLDHLIFNTLTFLVPLNLLFISYIKERGIFTWKGLSRMGIIILQPFFIYTLIRFRYLESFAFLDFEIVNGSLLNDFFIPQFSLILFLVAAIYMIVNFILKKDVIEGGLFWALLCTFLAFLPGKSTPQSTMYLATAGLILIMSILEYSHNLAFRDELTGLPARRSLNETFLKLPSRYSIAMLDIDHFKKFNDQYGHDVGDQLLRMVANKILKVSGGGKAFRYGGEEFTIIFPGKTANESRPHVELLRKTISATPFYIRSNRRPTEKPEDLENAPRSRKQAKVTVSIGVAERDENHDEPHDVLKAADEALLRAKRAGRDRVRLFGRLHTREQ